MEKFGYLVAIVIVSVLQISYCRDLRLSGSGSEGLERRQGNPDDKYLFGTIDNPIACRETNNSMFVRLSVDTCGGYYCHLSMGTPYASELVFRVDTPQEHAAFTLRLGKDWQRNTTRFMTGPFEPGREHRIAFDLKFDLSFSGEEDLSNQDIQVEVYPSGGFQPFVCRFFPIKLQILKSGGTKLKENCTLPGMPCNFPWSLCHSNSSCGCQDSAVDEWSSCKQKAGSYCTKSDDCLENGNCHQPNRTCICNDGYHYVDPSVCQKGGAFIYALPAIFLLLQHIFIFVATKL